MGIMVTCHNSNFTFYFVLWCLRNNDGLVDLETPDIKW